MCTPCLTVNQTMQIPGAWSAMESASHQYQDFFIDFQLSGRTSNDKEGNPALVNLPQHYIHIYMLDFSPTGATSSLYMVQL